VKKWLKWIVLLGVVGLVVVVWLVARRQTFTPPWAEPKLGKVTRGDIRVPITAAGLIHAHLVVEVKSKASGEIIEVPVIEGTYVHKGDTLVVLKKDDEQRMLDRAQAEYERAQAMLDQARVAVERAEVGIAAARARLEEIIAQGQIIAFEKEKIEKTLRDGRSDLYSEQQVNDVRAQYRMNLAQQESARIAIRNAELTKEDAEVAVRSAEATVRAARKTFEDAEERLRETTVLAPRDGIVTQVFVKSGMLVQSGTQSLMGGTQLMTLADVSKKKVVARLDEADYGRVLAISPVDALPDMPQLRQAARDDAAQLEKRSGKVRIMVDAFPDLTFEGVVERVEPQGKLNPGSSIIQFDVHVEITDERRHMLPLGAQAQVEFTVESALGVLRVPAEAVKSLDDRKGVYVRVTPEPGGKYGKRFVPCRFGVSDGEFTELIEVLGDVPLKEGDEVYTKLPTSAGEGHE